MCEAEDELEQVERELHDLKAKVEAGEPEDFTALADAVDDMRRGIRTPGDVIDEADRLRRMGRYLYDRLGAA